MANGWLTPETLPVGNVTLTISIPDSQEWKSTIFGALLLLSEADNWEKFGTLTPEEVAQEWLTRVVDAINGTP